MFTDVIKTLKLFYWINVYDDKNSLVHLTILNFYKFAISCNTYSFSSVGAWINSVGKMHLFAHFNCFAQYWTQLSSDIM